MIHLSPLLDKNTCKIFHYNFALLLKSIAAKLKTEYAELQTEKAESLLSEILLLDKEDTNALFKSLASYILVVQNLGSITHLSAMRETMGEI